MLFVHVSYFSDTLTAEVEATADGDMLHSEVNSDTNTDSSPDFNLAIDPHSPELLS